MMAGSSQLQSDQCDRGEWKGRLISGWSMQGGLSVLNLLGQSDLAGTKEPTPPGFHSHTTRDHAPSP